MEKYRQNSRVLMRLQGAVILLIIILYMVLPDGRESSLPFLHFMKGFLTGLVLTSVFRLLYKRMKSKERNENGCL